ncbi:C40 family peptidase [Cohnella terricola]|uniref:NlpC/P60 family protein n=1 Tax=Cohnella terricola TaxID=1289167 RepID=A0A559J5Y6_9BACL|nr:NlpC/P60 family protein [Cohnella terricola]
MINPTKRMGKAMIGTALSMSIAFSAGAMLVANGSAYAATSNATITAYGASSSQSIADNITAIGKKYLGVPYQFGAKSNQTATFDCSSFTQYVFGKNGISLPRSSKQQSKVGTYVSKDQLQPGDLVFSDTNHDGIINHVSIYIGNNQLLHTYRVGIGVTISNFKGSAWDRGYVTARRVLPTDGTASAAPAQSDQQPASETKQPDYYAPVQRSDNSPYYSHRNHWHGYKNR